MQTIVGLIGQSQVGKETLVKLFRKIAYRHTVGHYRTSDILAETFKAWGSVIPFTRENAQQLVWIIENGFKRRGLMAQAMKMRIQKDSSDFIFYDTARWHYDGEVIKSFPRYSFIYITASEETRLRRAKARKLTLGGKVGENELTLQALREQDRHECEMFISGVGAKYANWIIENEDESEERFAEDIRKYFEYIRPFA